jgi:hypothetical protein
VKSAEEVMEILAAYDLTGSLRYASRAGGVLASHGGPLCGGPRRRPRAGACAGKAGGGVGFRNSATGLDLGLLCGSLVFVDEAAEDGPALDPLLGQVGDGAVRPGRAELAAAMRSPSVVVRFVLG